MASNLVITRDLMRESEYLRTLHALGVDVVSHTDVPSDWAWALPLLARIVQRFWNDTDAGVLPILEPERATLSTALHLYLSNMSEHAIMTLVLLSDYMGIERIRNACVYVLVKRKVLLHPAARDKPC